MQPTEASASDVVAVVRHLERLPIVNSDESATSAAPLPLPVCQCTEDKTACSTDITLLGAFPAQLRECFLLIETGLIHILPSVMSHLLGEIKSALLCATAGALPLLYARLTSNVGRPALEVDMKRVGAHGIVTSMRSLEAT